MDLHIWRRAPYYEKPSPHTPKEYVLTVVAYNRPEYLKQVLDHLAACDGIEKYTVLMFIEPVNEECAAVARSFNAAKRTVVHVNPVTMGFPHNLRQALEVGFTQSDFSILIEDDILLAKDALTWFEHARDAYEDDKEVFTVSVYGDVGHHPEAQLLDKSESMDTARRQHFTPWGWGTWKDRYDEMAHVYTGWDGQMNFEMVHINMGVNYEAFGQGLRKNRYEVFPVLSRANNIGMEDGIHSKWFKPDKMKELQFLFANTAPGLPSENEGVTVGGAFKELDEAGKVALCERCVEMRCGKDTVRGMCKELGFAIVEPGQEVP
mmetsp:Transcript_25045/g.67582  ORF Transcript_25045/g.67582 Transcript_25045/m.67582 type:complete len:320 (-) Transcript_25045:139-1098(-)